MSKTQIVSALERSRRGHEIPILINLGQMAYARAAPDSGDSILTFPGAAKSIRIAMSLDQLRDKISMLDAQSYT